jgi:acetyltransferase-like isoleucine patch superfamily enzyme
MSLLWETGNMYFKIFWVARALVYKLFLGSFGLPGYIGKPCFLLGFSKIYIGKRVRIFPGLRAEVHGNGRIVVGDNVSIGQNAHITCAGFLEIGRNTVMSGDVMITDIDHEFQEIGVPILDQPWKVSETVIGENCFIGLGARIQAGTRLGRHCIVGTSSVVKGEFQDYSVIVGSPARVVKVYCPESKKWERV